MLFVMKLTWAVPAKHMRAIQLRGNYPAGLAFKGYFLYESGESEDVDAAILCCIKNFGGDSTDSERILYTPTINYSVTVTGDVVLEYDEYRLKSHVLECWLTDRHDYERALDLLHGDITFAEFFA